MSKWYTESDVMNEVHNKMRDDLTHRLSLVSAESQKRFHEMYPKGVPSKDLASVIALVQRTINSETPQ